MTDQPEKLQWYEVAWTMAVGTAYVKAGSESEAKKIASEEGFNDSERKLDGGREIKAEWYEPIDQTPYISDCIEVEERDVPGMGDE